MKYLGIEYSVQNLPGLEPEFIPFGVWIDAYEKEASKPLTIAIERDKGKISVHHTKIIGTPELAEAAVSACGDGNAVLLANHGLVACGESLPAAFSLAEDLEYTAELQWRCLCAGTPHPLSHDQLEQLRVRFQTYGQTNTTV